MLPTFGKTARAKVIDVHDVSVHFQRDALDRGLQLHAAVADQHIYASITFHQINHHVLHAVHVTEVQDHQLWSKCLGRD